MKWLKTTSKIETDTETGTCLEIFTGIYLLRYEVVMCQNVVFFDTTRKECLQLTVNIVTSMAQYAFTNKK